MHRSGLKAGCFFSLLFSFLLMLLPCFNIAHAEQVVLPFQTPLSSMNNCGSGVSTDTHFTLAATGDFFPHLIIQHAGESLGYDYLFDKVRPFLANTDLGYTNFDGALLEDAPLSEYPNFNFSPQLAPALKKAGIGVVSTANNHILDKGLRGLDATLKVLDNSGILQHGTVSGEDVTKPRPPYLPINLSRNGVKVKIGFLSFTWGTNGIPDPNNQVNLLWETNEYGRQGKIRPQVLEAIAQARSETDFVVVAAHWGQEYNFYPEEYQIEGAKQMAAAGADVILGSQPHTLQPLDIIETGNHKTLVIYSLANFLAAQSWNQQEKFTNTSVILYVGFARREDGKVQLTGYRYLPIMMTDGETRTAPFPAENDQRSAAHVRELLRDPSGLQQFPEAPLPNRLEVCPTLSFPEASDNTIRGDFYRYYTTLGNNYTRSLQESVAIIGLPLGKVKRELSGDCSQYTYVLYTERQRLELQPDTDWPFRIVGTQLGTEVYKEKYKLTDVERLPESEIASELFQNFYQKYGGVVVFGYPISGELRETDSETGFVKTVQYFERSRFETVLGTSGNPNPLYSVQLGLLGKEYAGIEAQCTNRSTAINKVVAQPPKPGTTSSEVRKMETASKSSNYNALWQAIILTIIPGVVLLSANRVWNKIKTKHKHAKKLALQANNWKYNEGIKSRGERI
ncbi:MAG: CapA family protein [Chloroflexi bacterium]|uniref:CapA family protein n=1 Tax=Candidatus Chlorohelix allophototropha TaxID=3003348 RepID=A0A8T7LWQ1_9CHLR|nr:CapA family protein [Chloroflexota bacterium]WJW67172.1 CapA family protein [Chloroflexota bacterium L227-S17]